MRLDGIPVLDDVWTRSWPADPATNSAITTRIGIEAGRARLARLEGLPSDQRPPHAVGQLQLAISGRKYRAQVGVFHRGAACTIREGNEASRMCGPAAAEQE